MKREELLVAMLHQRYGDNAPDVIELLIDLASVTVQSFTQVAEDALAQRG